MLRILFISRSTLYSQPGGDTIQINETAKCLRKAGGEVDIHLSGDTFDVSKYDVVHFFNLSRPQDILRQLPDIKKLVVTSIYIDYRLPKKAYTDKMQQWLYRMFGQHGSEYVKILGRWIKGREVSPGKRYIIRGQRNSIQKILTKADHLIVASNFEKFRLMQDFSKLPPIHKINLGSEHIPIGKATEKNGVISVARFETLKNQLGLIQAQKEKGFPLTLIGQAASHQAAYLDLCKKVASTEVTFKTHINHPELAEEYAKAKVHVLCSFYETTGLSTLEALKNGCQVVVSRNSAPEEIFGTHAHLCNPENVASIAAAVEAALQNNTNHSGWVQEQFSWEKAAASLLKIYQS